MTTYIFPGQGSQSKGMGGSLFSEFPEFTKKADDILGYSIQSLCLDDPLQQLGKTQYTQPALYVVNALTYFKKKRENSKEPSFVLGHSLGEYSALLASGVFDFETGLRLVKKRGELMSRSSGGAMAAIIGLKAENIQAILDNNHLTNVSIANHNTRTQIVISGLKEDVLRAQGLCEQAGAMLVVPLNVSGAFHSPYMSNAQEEFELFLKNTAVFRFNPPSIPTISNYTARPYKAENILENISKQITHPVRWTESVVYLLETGEQEFIEIGPGVVLTGLVNRIKNGS